MCGRFALIHTPEQVSAHLAVDFDEAFPPRYNIAPTQPVLVAFSGDGPPPEAGSNRPDRAVRLMRWGLLPRWVKEPADFPLLINARSETAAEKASFRAAMRHRRCIIPASGFYEWQRDKASGKSQAWWVPRADGQPAAFAGLHETWASADGSEIDTCAILTAEAREPFSNIHTRVPVIIEEPDIGRWLDCRSWSPEDVADLMRAPEDGVLSPVPVSDAVNKVANTGASLIEPVEPKDGFGLAGLADVGADDGDGQGSLF